MLDDLFGKYLFRASRRGSFGKPREFWSDQENYAFAVLGLDAHVPRRRARILTGSAVLKMKGSPSKRAIALGQRMGADILQWESWDYKGHEYVVLNPASIRIEEP